MSGWENEFFTAGNPFETKCLISPLYSKLPTISGFYGKCCTGPQVLMSGRRGKVRFSAAQLNVLPV